MKKYLKENSSTILTCVSAIGVIFTAITSAKAAPKANRILSKYHDEKSKLKKIKKVIPVYLPTIVIGASTIVCVFGANVLNLKNQASIISAYSLLNSSYKKYMNKTKELYGEDVDIDVRKEICKDSFAETNIYLSGDKKLFFDEFSMRYFESTMENVLRAEYLINKKFASEFFVTVNEFYDLLGIDRISAGDELKWRSDDSVAVFDSIWIDFENEPITYFDGLECCIISMKNRPEFDFS